MPTAPENADVVAILKKHGETLSVAAAMEVSSETPAAMDIAIRSMLYRAADLTRGAASLGEDNNAVALEVVCRALLENLITLLWVQVDAVHPDQLKVAGVAELERMFRLNLESGVARVLRRDTGEDATAEYLASKKSERLPRRTSVEVRARQAGVEDLYNVFYRALSMGVHGHALRESSNNAELSLTHMQGVAALALATGHSGVRWLVHRQRTDNETLRDLLGLAR